MKYNAFKQKIFLYHFSLWVKVLKYKKANVLTVKKLQRQGLYNGGSNNWRFFSGQSLES